MHWKKVYKLPVNSIRIFNTFGPRLKTTGTYGAVFGVFLKQKLSKKPLTLVGDGKQRRDYLFVTDVAKAFETVARIGKNGEIYNIGAGSPQSIKKLANLIGGKIVKVPLRPGEPHCTWANINKIKKAYV